MRQGAIHGVLLAAGGSSRMGRPKLALPFRGGTLGGAALAAACGSGLDRILVVTRGVEVPSWLQQEELSPLAQSRLLPAGLTALTHSRLQLVPCLHAREGQAYSLRAGAAAAIRQGAEAIVVLLADQPLMTTAAIDKLIAAYEACVEGGQQPAFVAACREGESMPLPPVLFAASMFPALLALTGDEGARRLLRGPQVPQGIMVGFREPGLFLDIDTPECYRELLKIIGHQVAEEPNNPST